MNEKLSELCFQYINSDLQSDIIKFIRKQDVCCLNMGLDNPGDIWWVQVKGGNYSCKEKVFIEKDGLSLTESLAVAALYLCGLTKAEIYEKIK